MKIETLSCVVRGKKDVDVVSQQIEFTEQAGKTLVKILRGGICGSDLHYYHEGKIGQYQVLEPMILGHEVVALVVKTDSPHLHEGQKVAINPSKPCLTCQYCQQGHSNQCENMRFFGSAMYRPHVQGGFSQFKIVETSQCIPYPTNSDKKCADKIMVFAEPLAVAIHAVKQVGDIQGKRVFISGVGPIGSLITAVAKQLGAKEVICADLSARCLQIAKQMGADQCLDAIHDDFSQYELHKGVFDCSFEVSGHISSIQRCLAVTKAKGTIVQIGMGTAISDFPIMTLVAKEINWKGSFRFVEEFNLAVEWLATNRIDPLPLLSAELNFNELKQALDMASNKAEVSKVQLVFAED